MPERKSLQFDMFFIETHTEKRKKGCHKVKEKITPVVRSQSFGNKEVIILGT